MHLTQQTDYGLRILLYLAARPEAHASVRQIAETFGISYNHLSKVARALHASGFVETKRGVRGGLRLARDPEQINVGDVVRRLEPNLGVVECMRSGGRCLLTPACGLVSPLDQAMGAFLGVLDQYSLAEAAVPSNRLLREAL